MLVSYKTPGGTPRERELEHQVRVKGVELEERGRLLYKTKAAIEGLQHGLAKTHDEEARFKAEARNAFEEQGTVLHVTARWPFSHTKFGNEGTSMG